MANSPLDNIPIKDLPKAIKDDSILTRYAPLVPIASKLCNTIQNAGIKKSHDLQETCHDETQLKQFARQYKIEPQHLSLLLALLHFQRYRPVPLTKFEMITPEQHKQLKAIKIKNTEALMLACRTQKQQTEIAKATNLSAATLKHILSLADLTRLPGIKIIRATLYHDAGYKTIKQVAMQDPDKMRQSFIHFIDKHQRDCTPPQPKELTSQIRWAKVYPKLLDIE